jgi:hypothetical protein
LKTIVLAYAKAPQYQPVWKLLNNVIDTAPGTIGELASRSILAVCDFLGLSTRIERTSTVYANAHLHAQDRVLDICPREGARLYINAAGGQELYSQEAFAARGIDLRFLRSRLPTYPQFNHPFVPSLSILDVLMFNSRDRVRTLLTEYELEENSHCRATMM